MMRRRPFRGFPAIGLVVALSVLSTVWLAACGGSGTADSPLERGRGLYLRSCALCHGHSGEGRANMGNPLVDNDFLRSTSDTEVIAFLKRGRMPSDPDNVSGRPMPPKGGDPRLTDQDLAEIVLFMRTLDGP